MWNSWKSQSHNYLILMSSNHTFIWNSFYKNSHSLRQDCLWCAKEVCHALHDAHIAARMLRHSWIHLIISFPLRIGKEKISNTIIYSNLPQNRALSWQKQTPHSFPCGALVLPVSIVVLYPIRLIKYPTNAPPGVPIILPRRAIRIPIGTSALLYAPASTGAVAVPPTFAREATAQVKISSRISFARITITAIWISRIRNPAASHTGAFPIAEISALEAIIAMTM